MGGDRAEAAAVGAVEGRRVAEEDSPLARGLAVAPPAAFARWTAMAIGARGR